MGVRARGAGQGSGPAQARVEATAGLGGTEDAASAPELALPVPTHSPGSPGALTLTLEIFSQSWLSSLSPSRASSESWLETGERVPGQAGPAPARALAVSLLT